MEDLESSSSIQTEFIGKLSPILSEIRGCVEAIASLESPPKNIESLIQNLGRSLGLTLFAPLSNKDKVEALCREMMNVRFESSSWEFANETEDETGEETRDLTVDEALLELKYGREEGFKNGVFVLDGFLKDGMISSETILDEEVVRILCRRMASCKGNNRCRSHPKNREDTRLHSDVGSNIKFR